MRYEDENIWLTQKMMATLYDVGTNTINYHIKKRFEVSADKRRHFGTYYIRLDRFSITDINPDLSSYVETVVLMSRKDK